MAAKPNYQLFGRLRSEEFSALEADIIARGVMVSVEKDEDGNTLDGQHREEIAEKHGLPFKTIVRKFATEEEKREHVIKLNLARRHLEPWQWGLGFKMLLETKGVERGQGKRNDKKTSETVSEVAGDLGVEERTARNRLRQADAFEALPTKQRKAVQAGEIALPIALRKIKQKKSREPTAQAKLVEGIVENLTDLIKQDQKFACIYADPPWQYGNQATRAATDNHYSTMTVAEICAERVEEIAADNAHLHLWTTNAFLFEAQRVIEEWGFKYKSCLVWCKPQLGIGNYWRVSHEFLLFGLRGKCPFQDRSLRSWVEANRTEHSEKPDVVRAMVEKASPGPRLEMYGRRSVEGWTVYGNQVQRMLVT
jgi:N6-adenosine-specific RNA methylase IME4/ParB-like chromosome segregation protein Spo0J